MFWTFKLMLQRGSCGGASKESDFQPNKLGNMSVAHQIQFHKCELPPSFSTSGARMQVEPMGTTQNKIGELQCYTHLALQSGAAFGVSFGVGVGSHHRF
ncbi:MAG: hypothetical protein QOE33_3818 [Acidobacteriota bacterium]|nr:hypothetical protein [Acidobacteriota bacterium]